MCSVVAHSVLFSAYSAVAGGRLCICVSQPKESPSSELLYDSPSIGEGRGGEEKGGRGGEKGGGGGGGGEEKGGGEKKGGGGEKRKEGG